MSSYQLYKVQLCNTLFCIEPSINLPLSLENFNSGESLHRVALEQFRVGISSMSNSAMDMVHPS